MPQSGWTDPWPGGGRRSQNDSEATIAKQIGADEGALNGWLAGKVKPTFQSLQKIRDFLERQVKRRRGIAPFGYVPMKGNSPNGRRGKGGRGSVVNGDL